MAAPSAGEESLLHHLPGLTRFGMLPALWDGTSWSGTRAWSQDRTALRLRSRRRPDLRSQGTGSPPTVGPLQIVYTSGILK